MATAKRKTKAKRRKAKRHPGVVLMKPDNHGTGWRARFKDPDSGKVVRVTIAKGTHVQLTAEQCEDWAAEKSEQLAARRLELLRGAPRAKGTSLENVTEPYFKARAPRMRPASEVGYREAVGELLAWAKHSGVRSADDLTRGKLMEFRAAVINQPKKTSRRGEDVGTGAKTLTTELRAPRTVNTVLGKAGTVLRHARKADLLPRLTVDDLRDALEGIAATVERIEYLRTNECQQLIEAALRHDAVTFAHTRGEHAGAGRLTLGTTPRYDPIAPLAVFCLLSGCRLGEALGLQWSAVHLDLTDHDGHAVGEIHLEGRNVKTRRARTVDLAVSPALRTMLVAMKLKSGGSGSVFGLSLGVVKNAAHRMRNEYGAPAHFTWQALRRTCGTFLTNAPGLFGAASAYRSAAQLGHGVEVATRHYVGLERSIPRDARSLEAAMRVESQVAEVVARIGVPQNRQSKLVGLDTRG